MSDREKAVAYPPINRVNSFPKFFSRLIPALVAGGLFWAAYVYNEVKVEDEPGVQNLNSWQESDVPFGLSLGQSADLAQQFESNFHFYSPWEIASIPTTGVYESPMGGVAGAFTYNAQSFGASNKKRKGRHSGDDINGIGGKNSDLGQAIYSVANGLVVYVGTPHPSWGKCIVLAHRGPDGEVTQSMYAHMSEIEVRYMEQVSKGVKIGTAGDAGGVYMAHLHLEMRESDGVSPFLSGYPTFSQHDRVDPSDFIKKNRAADQSQLAPSWFQILLRNRRIPELEMDQESMMNYLNFFRKAEAE